MCLGNAIATYQPTLPSRDFNPDLREKWINWLFKKLQIANWTKDIAGEQDWNTLFNAFANAMVHNGLGVIMSGECGCGKTSFVKATGICEETIHCLLPEEVRWLNIDEYPDYVSGLLRKNVLIDDLGAQPLFNNYGTMRDYVAEFICRYELYGKGRLFCITNLRGEKLQEKMGDVVISRLKNLCVPAKLIGGDKRKWIV